MFQFLLRLAFGLAAAMAATSPRDVTSGYFRNHLYVVLGLCTLATLIAASDSALSVSLPLAAGVLSYLGTVAWLYERTGAGRLLLVAVALTALAAAVVEVPVAESTAGLASLWVRSEPLVAGAVMGTTLAAMLLGHWYLNTPTMKLAPLRRLLALAAAALICRAVVAALATWMSAVGESGFWEQPNWFWALLAIRWLFGLLGAGGLIVMAYRTLEIPNTQSATGILYVAVIATFLGELTAQLLSVQMHLPL